MFKAGITTIIGALVLQTGVFAQIYVKNTGNVGIGVTQPSAKLELPNAGNATLRVGISSNMANTHTQLINSLAVLADSYTTVSSMGATAWDFYNNGNSPSWAGTLLLHYGTGVTGTLCGLPAHNMGLMTFQNTDNAVISTNGLSNIYIAPLGTISTTFSTNGNVGIGNTNPGYKLHVMGDVRATRFIADGNTWADYVFDSTYQLPALQELEAYIKKNHHLPEVPSTEEVKVKGVDISDNQAILLKKIEELTLYTIEQNKKLLQLEEKYNELSEQVKRKNKKKARR